MAKPMRKINLEIQILAGNTLMSSFHVGFEIELPLTKMVSNLWIFGCTTYLFLSCDAKKIYKMSTKLICKLP